MSPDEEGLYAKCNSCDEGVLVSEAFKEGPFYYHPDCAQVVKCGTCGRFNEKTDMKCAECGEVVP